MRSIKLVLFLIFLFVSCNKEPDILQYDVSHYLEIVDEDDYSYLETQELFGNAGEMTQAEAKTIVGFTTSYFEQKRIRKDADNDIDIYYNRNKYSISWDGGIGMIRSGTYGLVDFEHPIHQPSVISPDDYVFRGWKKEGENVLYTSDGLNGTNKLPDIMPAENLYFTADYESVKTELEYTVEHYFQNIQDDDYVIESQYTETKKANAGDTSQALSKDIEGFHPKSIEQITISKDDDRVVKVYYDRNVHSVNYSLAGCVLSGEYTEGQVRYQGQVILPKAEQVTAPEGYVFNGWLLNGGEEIYGDDAVDLTMPDYDLYWSVDLLSTGDGENIEYTVEYYFENIEDDGYTLKTDYTQTLTGKVGSQTIANGLSDVEKIRGFELREAPEQKILTNGVDVSIQIFYKRKSYRLAYDMGDGEIDSNASHGNNIKYGTLLNPVTAVTEKDNEIFLGFYLNGNNNILYKIDDDAYLSLVETMPDKDLVFTAVYDFCLLFKLYYNKGDDESFESIKFSLSDVLSLSADFAIPTRSNYIFNGYWTSKEVFDNDGFVITDNIMLINEEGKFVSHSGLIDSELKWIGSEKIISLYAQWANDIFRYDDTVGLSLKYSYSGQNCPSAVVVPRAVSGKKVVNLTSTFKSCTKLVSVCLPDTVNKLKSRSMYYDPIEGVFELCESLKSVNLPNSIDNIGTRCFYGCKELESIKLPRNYNYINTNTFYGCSKLKNVDISEVYNENGLFTISESAFKDCASLSDLDFETTDESIKKIIIDRYAFENTAIKSFHITDKIARIYEYGFKNCSLSEIHIDRKIDSEYMPLSLDDNCFALLNSDISVINFYLNADTNIAYSILSDSLFDDIDIKLKVSASVSKIPSRLFKNVSKLISVEFLNEGELFIEYEAFANTSLTSLDLSTNISLGEGVFSNCAINSLNISTSELVVANKCFSFNNGEQSLRLTLDVSPKSSWFSNSGIGGDIQLVLTQNVTDIPDNCFKNCSNIIDVDTSNATNLKTIGESAFEQTSISSINLPDSVETIQKACFKKCANLIEIRLSSKITLISEECFMDDTKLESIIIHNSIKNISSSAFKNCTSLNEVNVDEATSLESIGNNAFENCTALKRMDFSIAALKELGEYSFKNTGLDYPLSNPLVFSDTITTIKTGSFMNCAGIKAIVLNNSITQIDQYCFYKTNISSLQIPENIKTISRYAFAYTQIGEVVIPSSVQTIEGYAFGYIPLKSIQLQSNSVELAEYSFFVNTEEESEPVTVRINENIESPFKRFVNGGIVLKIGENVETICEKAFSAMNASFLFVKKLDLSSSSSLKSIGKRAFYLHAALEDIDFSGCTSLESIGDECFSNALNSSYYCDLVFNCPLLNTFGAKCFEYCRSIKNLDLGECTVLETLPINSFQNCSNIESIILPKSLKEVNLNRVFYNCSKCTSVTVKNEEESIYKSIDGVLYIKNGDNLATAYYPSGRENSSLTFPDNCTEIRILYGTKLTEVNIPKNTQTIIDGAFAYLSALQNIFVNEQNENYKSVDGMLFSPDGTKLLFCPCQNNIANDGVYSVPDNIEALAVYSFFGNKNLKKIILNEKNTIVDKYVFFNSSLEEIDIPSTFTSFDVLSLAFAKELRTINYNGTMAGWENIKKATTQNPDDGIEDWIYSSGTNNDNNKIVVHCLDGDIELSLITADTYSN